MELPIIVICSVAVLLVAYLTAISAKDLIRLLISLELMFAAVLMAIIPLFSVAPLTAYTIAILAIFTSSSELMVLITAIIILDRQKSKVDVDSVAVGGDSL